MWGTGTGIGISGRLVKQRGCPDDVADCAKFNDEDLRRQSIVLRAGIPGIVDAMDAGLLVRGARHRSPEPAAIVLQRCGRIPGARHSFAIPLLDKFSDGIFLRRAARLTDHLSKQAD